MWPTHVGWTEPCEPIRIIFGHHINGEYTSLNIEFGVNRMFHVSQYTDLTYMGGTVPCGSIMIVFGNHIYS